MTELQVLMEFMVGIKCQYLTRWMQLPCEPAVLSLVKMYPFLVGRGPPFDKPETLGSERILGWFINNAAING